MASGLTLSTTVMAESFTQGSGYVNVIGNVGVSVSMLSVRSVSDMRRSGTITAGFNMRSVVEDEGYAAGARTDVDTRIADIFTSIDGVFNDRS